jgi:MFS family permease
MELEQQKPHVQDPRAHKRFVMYITAFLFALSANLPFYVNSSFLSQFLSESSVGLVYALSSAVAILVFFLTPGLLERFGNFRLTLAIFCVQLLALIGLGAFSSGYFIIPLFVLSFVSVAILNFNLDIFVEHSTDTEHMGRVRGIFLTSANLAWIVAPLLSSFILTDNDYWKLYLAGATLTIPTILLIATNLAEHEDGLYHRAPLFETLRKIAGNKNIFGSFAVNFTLQMFYAWMVIYMPIYLHSHIGFTWDEIGVMFSIMLLPFVITEAPLGKLADKRWGEKEMMAIGFIIVALATGVISFVTSNSLVLWTSILLITRIGASIVEIMTETYFFKKIDGEDINVMSIYRTMRPTAYIIGPVIATILLSVVGIDIQYLFAILGLIMFIGLRYSLTLEDTR